MKTFFKYLFALILVSAVSAGTTWLVLQKASPEVVMTKVVNGDTVSTVPVQYQRFASLPQAGETDFTNAAELSVNAVVHVKTTYKSQSRSYMSDPFFEFFFGRPG